jgi:predicted RNA polymerase sigma factor
VVEALEHWPADGVPDRPGAWLLTTARHKAMDRLRRAAKHREKLSLLVGSGAAEIRGEADDRLRLIFTCCHPALARESQVALTLRAVMGLTTREIARAFLIAEATMAQRIVRAKRKIVDAGIPFHLPDAGEMSERLAEVLAVLYLTFNEGFLTSGGGAPERRELAQDAMWLSRLLMRLVPDEPEVIGLLVLMRLQLARAPARFNGSGALVLLQDQDRDLWNREEIASAAALLEDATHRGKPGPYQMQAAIAACHAEAPSWEETDWRQILLLYGALQRRWPTPIVRLNRAVAMWHAVGAGPALVEVDDLGDTLSDYHLMHATRAQLLRALGREAEARTADSRALALAVNPAERAVIEQRLLDP